MINNASVVLVTLLYFYLLTIFWNTVSADESYVSSRKYLEEGKVELALSQANKSIDKNPNEPRYYYNRAKIYLATKMGSNKQKALTDLGTAEKINNKNLVSLRNMVPIYYLLSLQNLDESLEADKIFLAHTRRFYEKMNSYSTNDVGLYALLYKYEEKLELTDLANQSKEKILELRPDLFEWYIIKD